MLPVPGRAGTQTALVVDGDAANGAWVGLEYVNKKPVGTFMKASLGKRLANDTTYTLLVRVATKDGTATVRAEIDGKEVSDWTGPVADLTPSLNWFTPDRTQLGLGVSDKCRFRIDSVEFRPVSGTADWRPGPPDW